mgnify:CR=1 FL=1
MENKSHALAAGLFVLLASCLVAGLAMWLTRDNGDYVAYELTTSDGVSGLQPQAAVRYKGVAVGKVTHIGFDPELSGNVLIRISVAVDAPITPTTFATLGYQGVTGLARRRILDLALEARVEQVLVALRRILEDGAVVDEIHVVVDQRPVFVRAPVDLGRSLGLVIL